MTRQNYVRALENIRDIVEGDANISTGTRNAIIAEIGRAVPGKSLKYGEYEQCLVCCHTPLYCDC